MNERRIKLQHAGLPGNGLHLRLPGRCHQQGLRMRGAVQLRTGLACGTSRERVRETSGGRPAGGLRGRSGVEPYDAAIMSL